MSSHNSLVVQSPFDVPGDDLVETDSTGLTVEHPTWTSEKKSLLKNTESAIEAEKIALKFQPESRCQPPSKSTILGTVVGATLIIIIIIVGIVLGVLLKTNKLDNQLTKLVETARKNTIAYERLGYALDTFGSRISGSQNLNDFLFWMNNTMQTEDKFHVTLDPVQVPQWVRGNESLWLQAPLERPMAMLGLGGSIGTGAAGIEAEVLVVKSKADLDARKDQVAGKIVVYNQDWAGSYGQTVTYRSNGASWAAAYGAVAALVKSITPVSLQTPHTGIMSYNQSLPKIPAAAITLEDAEYLARLAARNVTIRVKLYMEAKSNDPVTSYNILGEIRGSTHPDEIIVIGGHSDSWDVGQGAHDDAGPLFTAWGALNAITAAGIVPKRTIRVVGWVNEEQGGSGARAYVQQHEAELPRTVMAMESDGGVFTPTYVGFSTSSSKALTNAVRMGTRYIRKHLGIDVQPSSPDADTYPLYEKSVPIFSLRNNGNSPDTQWKYFWYHHTQADTFDKIDLKTFQENIAVFAVVAYLASENVAKLRE